MNEDVVKSLADLFEPDSYLKNLVIINHETHESRRFTVTDMHRRLSQIKLNSEVPEEIQRQFATVKNLYLYGWFVDDFLSISAFQALLLAEMALRHRLGYVDRKAGDKKPPGLKGLLKEAQQRGLLVDEGFSVIASQRAQDETDPLVAGTTDKYVSILIDALPFLRNGFAHPSGPMGIGGSSMSILVIVSELINQLFQSRNS